MATLMFEVEENPNCEGMPQLIFNTLTSGRRITHIRTSKSGKDMTFHRITGWCSEGGGSPCEAWAVRIIESGSGEGLLIYGGDWGVRFMDPKAEGPWDINSPNQWGETYLILLEDSDVRYA